jgi:SAM-dependent methyltransferase
MGFPKGDPALERGPAFYDQAYREKSPLQKPWWQQPLRVVAWYPALLLAKPPIFDVGCGAGHLAAMCSVFGVDYARGIDFSSAAIKSAKRQAPNAEFIVSPAAEAKAHFARQDYKTAVFLEVLEHVYHDLELLRLVPKGRTIVASVPSFHTDGHVRWFTSKDEVIQRYNKVVRIDRIVTEPGQSGGGKRWFVFRGGRV